jgi:hypothetical protein
MRWISIEPEAEGVIAIGTVATGVIALGQVATGVIAIGQLARGFVAIGQGAVGVVAVGMGAMGLVWSAGMFGAGGRGFGLVIPLVPSLGSRAVLPPTMPPAQLLEEETTAGFISATLDADEEGPFLRANGRPVAARFDARLRKAVEAHPRALPVLAHLTRAPEGWVCDALVDVPKPRWEKPEWWAWWVVQGLGLIGLAVAFWLLAGIPVIRSLFGPGGVIG